MENDDDTEINREPAPSEVRRTAELRIPLTATERKLLGLTAGGNTATWARLVLLSAAKAQGIQWQ